MKTVATIFTLAVLLCAACTNSHSEKTASFDSADSLRYEMQLVNKSYKGCDPDSQNCTYIEYSYPLFTNATPPLYDSIEYHLMQLIGAKQNLQQGIYSLIDTFLVNYDSLLTAYPEYTLPWEKTVAVSVFYQDKKYLTLEMGSYEFTGGAHGISNLRYAVIDKSSGKILDLSTIYTPEKLNTISILAEQIFRKQYNLSPNANLDSAGFWFDKNTFAINTNFYLSKDGIGFVYNQYEIASYVQGEINLFIPYTDFQ